MYERKNDLNKASLVTKQKKWVPHLNHKQMWQKIPVEDKESKGVLKTGISPK